MDRTGTYIHQRLHWVCVSSLRSQPHVIVKWNTMHIPVASYFLCYLALSDWTGSICIFLWTASSSFTWHCHDGQDWYVHSSGKLLLLLCSICRLHDQGSSGDEYLALFSSPACSYTVWLLWRHWEDTHFLLKSCWGFSTRMVYLCYISCLRDTILVGNRWIVKGAFSLCTKWCTCCLW